MKLYSYCIFLTSILLSQILYGQQLAPSIIWSKTFGGSNGDRANSIIRTVDNGFLIVGGSNSNDGDVTGHHGSTVSSDAWVIKLSPDGSIEWQRSLGGTNNDEFRSVITTRDGSYLCMGLTESNDGDVVGHHGERDIWIVKLSRSGTIIWQKCYGGSNRELAGNIKELRNGEFYLIGSTDSNDGDVSGNHGGFADIWIVRFNTSGSIIWQKCLGGARSDLGYDIVETDNGSFIIAIESDSDDGNFGTVGANSPRGVMIKLDSNCVVLRNGCCANRQRIKQLTKIGENEIVDLTEFMWCYPSNSNYGITVSSFIDLPGAQPPTDGTQYARFVNCRTSNYVADGPYALAASDPNTLLLAATTNDAIANTGYIGGGGDGFLSGLKKPGGVAWKKLIGGARLDILRGIAVINENEFVVAGHSTSFNGSISDNSVGFDVWVVKLGNVNTIKGTVFLDYNLNGLKDINEPYTNNVLVESEKSSQKSGSLSHHGRFSNSVDTGNYVTTIISNVNYYTPVPASRTSTFSSYNNFDSVTFALQPIPNKRDYRITIFPETGVRPGFPATYKIRCINVGTDTLVNRAIRLIKDNRLNFLSSIPAQTSVSGDTILWTISGLNPRDTVLITVDLQVSTPPIVNIGDALLSTAIIETTGDLQLADNISVLRQFVTGAYDPNDKQENGGGIISVSDISTAKNLTYTIRFQNTGTDTAFNIIIRDTLSSKLDFNSIEMVDASHDYHLQIKNGKYLTWTFNDIKLVDSNHNEPKSHGYISYSIKPKNNLVIGDTIKNSASIYFDFNLPVKTNTQLTIVQAAPLAQPVVTGIAGSYCSLQSQQKGKINNLPTPTDGITITVTLDDTIELGVEPDDSTFTFNVSTLSEGNHTIKVTFNNSSSSKTTTVNFSVTQAVSPNVNVSANITTILNLNDPVIVTATNASGGGTTPLYTFAKDRTFNNILQAEGPGNTLNIVPSTLAVGENWIYARMKTSSTCFITQTNVDSIKLIRDATTGIVDVDYPGRVINIYPNPFSDRLQINGLSTSKVYSIIIYNVNGQLLYKKRIGNRSSVEIKLESPSTFTFLLSIYDEKKKKLLGTVKVQRKP